MGVRETRQAFADRVARAQYGSHVTVITKHGVDAAMLIPPVPAELRARLMELLADAEKARNGS